MSDLAHDLVLIANAGDGTISTLRMERREEPRLEMIATSVAGQGCSTFAIDAERDLVFAAYKGEPAGIVTLKLDRTTGELHPVSRRDVDASMTYLALDASRSFLLGASYGGGFGEVWPVGNEGDLGEATAHVEFANLHCVVPDRGHAYFVSLGDDLIAQYDLGEDGTLTPLDPATIAQPDGSGPRHLIIHDENAYLVTEFSGEVIRHDVGAYGSLAPAESVSIVDPSAGLKHSRIGADPTQEGLVWGADVHRAGRWIIGSERSASTLATVALDAAGHLGEVADFAPTETRPRGFAVTDDGQFVIAVGEKSTAAALSRVEDDGRLTVLARVGIGRGANWVRIIAGH